MTITDTDDFLFEDGFDLDLEEGPADPDWEAFHEFQELDRIDFETSMRFRNER